MNREKPTPHGMTGRYLQMTMSRSESDPDIKPFPPDWLELFDVETLERLAIMTIDGGLTDSEALTMLAKVKFKQDDNENYVDLFPDNQILSSGG